MKSKKLIGFVLLAIALMQMRRQRQAEAPPAYRPPLTLPPEEQGQAQNNPTA